MTRNQKNGRKSGKNKQGIILFAVLFVLVFAGGVVAVRYICHRIDLNMYPKKYNEYVEKYAAEYGVEEDFVYAVIHTESRFHPDAVSSIGARGLMQLTEDTYDWAKMRMGDDREHTYDDLFDPELNIQYGIYVLKLLQEEFVGTDTVLAAYHAGWGSVKGWLDDPNHSADGVGLDDIPFADTAHYVKTVQKTLQIYKDLYEEE